MAITDFKLTRPCDNCPFRIEGGIRLRVSRAREIARSQTDSQGSTFSCHKTVVGDDDEPRSRDEQYCAGAIAYALNVGTANQYLRIAGRMGWFSVEGIKDRDKVFASETAMLKVQDR